MKIRRASSDLRRLYCVATDSNNSISNLYNYLGFVVPENSGGQVVNYNSHIANVNIRKYPQIFHIFGIRNMRIPYLTHGRVWGGGMHRWMEWARCSAAW